jgi:phospholipase/carboxylesterase
MLDAELVPAAEGGSKRLMVVLHGLGDSREGYRWLPPTLGLPWLNYLLVDAPDLYFGGYSWFDFPDHPAPGIERSCRLLFELLDAWRGRGYPTEATALFGFSQGCLMVSEVGLRYPHRFAGIVGISGWVNDPERLLGRLSPVAREQRLLITHGTLDPMVPFAPAKAIFNLLRQAGIGLEWQEFNKGHTIDEHRELQVIRGFLEAGFSCVSTDGGGS